MRGKDAAEFGTDAVDRITPAYAGKSLPSLPPAGTAEDHPRLCGEKLRDFSPEDREEGSPPPMRGKALDKSLSIPKDGITPAYAGKRSYHKRQAQKI